MIGTKQFYKMNIVVNSEPKQFTGKSISELAQTLHMTNTNGTAFAVNEKVVPKSEWGIFELKENDKVLIIKATQGG